MVVDPRAISNPYLIKHSSNNGNNNNNNNKAGDEAEDARRVKSHSLTQHSAVAGQAD